MQWEVILFVDAEARTLGYPGSVCVQRGVQRRRAVSPWPDVLIGELQPVHES